MERWLFETGVASSRGRRVVTLPFSLVIHAVVVTTALVIPVLTEDNLPEVAAASRSVFFAEPPAIPAPPPPPARVPPGLQRAPGPSPLRTDGALIAPPQIPDGITDIPDFGVGMGSPDGVDGGDWQGITQEIVRGLPPPPVAPQVPQRPGGVIREPRKIRDVLPVYSPLAITTHIQGDVVLDCVINAQGRITDVTVISGPPLLIDAAKQAAYQWVYTPTLLNGIPIPILLRATVKFRLR